MKKAPSGKLLAEFAAEGSPVSIDTATCAIKASHSFTVSNPSESWTASTSATLKVSGDTATGSYTLSNSGFCKGMATGTLSATRE